MSVFYGNVRPQYTYNHDDGRLPADPVHYTDTVTGIPLDISPASTTVVVDVASREPVSAPREQHSPQENYALYDPHCMPLNIKYACCTVLFVGLAVIFILMIAYWGPSMKASGKETVEIGITLLCIAFVVWAFGMCFIKSCHDDDECHC